MPALLVIVLTWFTRYLIFQALKYVFTVFLGVVSFVATQALINRYINKFLDTLMQTENVSIIMNLSRLDDAISIIVGAMTICAAIKALGIKVTAGSG